MLSPEVRVEPVVVPTQATRARSVRGYIVFAFALGLILAIAYLMREILLLLYVSALFAVVFTLVCMEICKRRNKPGLLGLTVWIPFVDAVVAGYVAFSD